MKKYPHGLTLNAVCAAIDDYQRHEDSVPEEGILAAFNTLLGHSDIAEAFRSLEQEVKHQLNVTTLISKQHNRTVVERDDWKQRAEAAEEKLAELSNQPPVAYTDAEELDIMQKGTYADMFKPCDEYKSDPKWIPLFTHPAPAAALADLLSRVVDSGALTSPEHEAIEAECCSILHNIKEANK